MLSAECASSRAGSWNDGARARGMGRMGPCAERVSLSESYGNSADDSQPWSIKWSTRDYDEIMIATGDFQHWLIVDKDELIGSSGTKYYSNQPVKIKASSEQCDPYYGESSTE